MEAPLRPLPPVFYQRPVLEVAPALLGSLFIRRSDRHLLVGRVVEVEAYREDDPASHSYRRRTERNEVMFGPGGHLYVYFTYGMHFCANVVTGPEDRGEAVLLRAVEPLWGIDAMADRRYGRRRLETRKELLDLTAGPARLCEAFGLGRKDNGRSLQGPEVFLAKGQIGTGEEIVASTRIGVSDGKEKKWRWYLGGNPWVSR
jgi:DNA-3-methyladenine glycosylase